MPGVKPGDRINNYLLESPAGQGSFAQVWRAKHHVLNQTVAVKLLIDPQYVRNFRQEGVVVHGLQHPNIVRAFDIDPYADPPYLIMEFVDGPSLKQAIEAHPRGLPIPAAVEIMRGVLSGLVCAHQAGLVHRDIKPANILLNLPLEKIGSATQANVKVGDFGLGRTGGATMDSMLQSGSLITADGQNVAGTLAYMAPEQKTAGALDGRSDLYACGIVLFEMLTGLRPEGNELPSEVRAEVPPELDRVFDRSYARLDRRFASATEMLDALSGSGGRRPPPPPPGRKRTPVPRPPHAAAEPACPSCRGAIGSDDQFCIHCGWQLVESVPRCAACRAFLNSADRYCIFCGVERPAGAP